MNLIDLEKWKKEKANNSDKEIDEFLQKDRRNSLLKGSAFVVLAFILVWSLILLFATAAMTLY
jgi:hypothetical protein